MERESSFEMRTGYKETMSVVVSRVEEATILLPTNLHYRKKAKLNEYWFGGSVHPYIAHTLVHISGESFQYIMCSVL